MWKLITDLPSEEVVSCLIKLESGKIFQAEFFKKPTPYFANYLWNFTELPPFNDPIKEYCLLTDFVNLVIDNK